MAYTDDYKRTIAGRAVSLMGNARKRCKEKNIELAVTQQWIEKRLIGVCEITNMPFCFEPPDQKATRRWNAPSLDRINKDKPYTEDNTRVILWAVNCALSEYGTEIMLPILRAMIKGIESAKAQSAAPVSTGYNIQGELYPELGTFSATWTGQNDDNTDHHCGADARQDIDHRAQTGSGDGLGHGGQEVGTPKTPQSQQDHGKPPSPIIWP